MSLWLLIPLNIPVYLFLGWIVFDTPGKAGMTFFETLVQILKCIAIPRFIRLFMDDDEEGEGVFSVVIFLIACIAVTWGEHWLIEKYWMTGE